MRAARLSEPGGSLEIVDVTAPEPGPGEVRVRIEASGVCYTDVHLAAGDWQEVDPLVKRPLILGHEGVGIVDAAGPGVTSPAVGHRVGVPFLRASCGSCRRCLDGQENLCGAATTVGMTHDGCHAEYVVADAQYVVQVPDGVPPEQAAPLCCAGVTMYGAIEQANLRQGDRVAVFGVGGLGHLAVQIAKAKGAWVVATDVDPAKLELARRFGADECIAATAPDVVERLVALGLEAVAVTTTSAEAHRLAVAAVSPGGTVLLCAVPGEPVPLSMVLAVFKGVTLVAQAVGSRQDLRETFALAARGQLRCEVTTAPLSDLPRVLDDLRAGQVLGRAVLTP